VRPGEKRVYSKKIIHRRFFLLFFFAVRAEHRPKSSINRNRLVINIKIEIFYTSIIIADGILETSVSVRTTAFRMEGMGLKRKNAAGPLPPFFESMTALHFPSANPT
jgi:hypothetical protein